MTAVPRCSTCPHIRRPILPEGPRPSRILFLGECGARWEDKEGRPFVGDTGKELESTYLPILGLPRSEVLLANAVWCSHKDYHNPTPAEAAACASVHLGALLTEAQPEIIVPMGLIACSLFPSIRLNLDHGLPLSGTWYSVWTGTLFPMYHPSAGLRQTGYMIALMRDFFELGKWLRGQGGKRIGAPVRPVTTYKVLHGRTESYDWLCENRGLELSKDTETTPDGKVFCTTLSASSGDGALIYAVDSAAIAELRDYSREVRPHSVFHNYLHDAVEYAKLDLPIHDFTDTMVWAYNLCLGGGGDDDEESRAGRGSLGLKTLAWRHCGMAMTGYKATVYPWSLPVIKPWLEMALTLTTPPDLGLPLCTCGCPQVLHLAKGKTGRRSGGCMNPDCTRMLPCVRYKWIGKEEERMLRFLNGGEYAGLNRKIKNLLKYVTGDVMAEADGEEEVEEDSTDSADAAESTTIIDPWKRLKSKGWREQADMLVEILGPYPMPSVEHLPEPVLVDYAVADADGTGRLKRFLDEYAKDPWLFW